MKVIVLGNYAEVSKEASRFVEEKIRESDELVLGLATGATPLGLYENLIDGYKTRGITYQNVKFASLNTKKSLSIRLSFTYSIPHKQSLLKRAFPLR
jgi:glucosamine-6-phosphate deaminase